MKKILFVSTASRLWAGGVYYVKNVVYSMFLNKNIVNHFEIHILVDDYHKDVFQDFETKAIVHTYKYKNDILLFIRIILLYYLNGISFVYGIPMRRLAKLGIKGAYWIPDFQHNVYPDFFKPEEIVYRNEHFKRILENSKNTVVLSSNSAYVDAKKYYDVRTNRIFIVHFVSYLDDVIKNIDEIGEERILTKYNLNDKKYVYIGNQFWKHKNHIAVAKAIRILSDKIGLDELDVVFVFTGDLNDYRNPEYIKELDMEFKCIRENKKHLLFLGFLPRIDQICIMKNSVFVIQPSLFEGWGTVLEDCKALDKIVLLSDIDVHREQKYDRCILFDPHDYNQLANIIYNEVKDNHHRNINFRRELVKRNAERYSLEIERMLTTM